MPNVADEKVTKWSIERGAFVGLDFADRRHSRFVSYCSPACHLFTTSFVDNRGHRGSEHVFMPLYLCPHLFTNDVANPDS